MKVDDFGSSYCLFCECHFACCDTDASDDCFCSKICEKRYNEVEE